MKNILAPISIFLVVAIVGCDKNNLAPIDSRTIVPVTSLAIVSPDSFYLDAMTPTGGNYHITAVITVKVDPQRTSGAVVTATVLRPTTSDEVARATLHDDGISPDQTTGDSVFSGQVDYDVTRAFAGRYRVQCLSITSDGTVGNLTEVPLKIARRNSSPLLLEASTPDSVDLPTSGYIAVKFTAVAYDSDGLADIRIVYFTRLDPIDTSQTRFFMRDDGGQDPPVNVGGILLRSGDAISGDGTFSFLIPITPQNFRRTNQFGFQAIDSFGDTSNTITKYFTIR